MKNRIKLPEEMATGATRRFSLKSEKTYTRSSNSVYHLSMMKKPNIRHLLWGFTCVVAVLFLIAVASAIRDRRLTWETLIHLTGPNAVSHAEVEVIHELGKFFNFMNSQYEGRGKPLPSELAKTLSLKNLREHEKEYGPLGPRGIPGFLKYLQSGVDPWGSPFRYIVDDRGQSVYFITIRSLGANGRDENGNGDDLQRTLWLSTD